MGKTTPPPPPPNCKGQYANAHLVMVYSEKTICRKNSILYEKQSSASAWIKPWIRDLNPT